VADVKSGFALGDSIRIRYHDYRVVRLTRRMVSSGGDPMVFIPLKDAQEAQFLKDNDATVNERIRTAANATLNRLGVPGLLDAINASADQQPQRQSAAGAARREPLCRDGGAGYPPLEAFAGL